MQVGGVYLLTDAAIRAAVTERLVSIGFSGTLLTITARK